MKKILTIVVSACAALTLAACGTSEADNAKSSIKAQLIKDSKGTSGIPLTDDQARCFANQTVDTFGVSTLKKYKLLTEDGKATTTNLTDNKLSKDDATKFVNNLDGCLGSGGLEKLFTDNVEKSIGSKGTATQKACIKKSLNNDAVKSLLAAQMSGDTSAQKSFISTVTKCFMG